MSTAAIEIKQRHRAYQLEQSPDSEEFSIVGGGTFKGIFDRSHLEDNKDHGNVLNKKLNPLIMVAVVPDGLIERTTLIRREGWETGDKEFTFFFSGKDEEGIPVLWLI